MSIITQVGTNSGFKNEQGRAYFKLGITTIDLGYIAQLENNPNESIPYYKHCIECLPSSAAAYYNLGLLFIIFKRRWI